MGLRPRVRCKRVERQLQLCRYCLSLLIATCSSRLQGSVGFAPTSALQACCTTANAVPPVRIGDDCGMLSTTAGIQFWDRDQECATTAMSPAVLGKNVGTWVDCCPCLHATSFTADAIGLISAASTSCAADNHALSNAIPGKNVHTRVDHMFVLPCCLEAQRLD